MYDSLVLELLVIRKNKFIKHCPFSNILTIADETHELNISPNIITLHSVTYTNSVMDRAMSLPLTKTLLFTMIHTEINEFITIDTRNKILELYRIYG